MLTPDSQAERLSITGPPRVLQFPSFRLTSERSTQHRLSKHWEGRIMSVARITEISSTSTKSFEDAIQKGITRATKTIRNVRSAWVKEQQIKIEEDSISEYQV